MIKCILTKLPNEVLCRIFCFLDFDTQIKLENAYPILSELYDNNITIINSIRNDLIIKYKVFFNKNDRIPEKLYHKYCDNYLTLIIYPHEENPKRKINSISNFKCPECSEDLIWSEECYDKYTGFVCRSKRCNWTYGLCKKWDSWL